MRLDERVGVRGTAMQGERQGRGAERWARNGRRGRLTKTGKTG